MAAVIVWATLKAFTPAGKLQFSKSHHTETLTFLDSSSWRLGEVLEEVEKWATKILRGDEGEDEEEEEKRERKDFGEKGFIVN